MATVFVTEGARMRDKDLVRSSFHSPGRGTNKDGITVDGFNIHVNKCVMSSIHWQDIAFPSYLPVPLINE